jgi:hypothetical protein
MQFEIRIDMPSGKYRMQVERIYAGDSIEKFKVTGGARSFILQSNRPQLLASNAKKEIQWKILEAPPTNPGNLENTTYAVYKIMQEIGLHLSKTEPDYRSYLQSRICKKAR